MKNELTLKLDTLLDEVARCNSNILEVKNNIKEYGYTDNLVDLLVDFNVIKTKLNIQIKDVQRGLEIVHKSIDYQTNKLTN